MPIISNISSLGLLNVEFSVVGPYYIGGSGQVGVAYEIPRTNMKLNRARLYVGKNGSSGSLVVDVKVSTDGGSNWSSIFSVKPSMLSSAQNYATSTNAVLADSSAVYLTSHLFRLDIDTVPGGAPSDFTLVLDAEAR